MFAIVYDRYDRAVKLRLADVPCPVIGRGEVLVRVTRAALNPKDSFIRKGRFRLLSGRRFPKLCGLDVAGVVAESRSPNLAAGQHVFGCLNEWTFRRGTLAEYVACRDSEVGPLPAGVGDDAAAGSALAGLTALQALRDVARLGVGERVLVNGASGGVGTMAIQIARVLGAEVHAVSSASNGAFCAELGAQHTWTYPEHAWKREAPFDVIFDVFGNLVFRDVRQFLTPRGRFVSTVPSAARLVRDRVSRLRGQQEERLVMVTAKRADLAQLAAWLESGRVHTVIDSRYALDGVRDAFARLESKRSRGKLVIEIA